MTRKKYLKIRTARKLVQDAKQTGKVFSVIFRKRTNGEPRRMLCRGRTRYQQKGDKPYEATDYDLVVVYDMEKRSYRSIPLDSVIRIKHRGRVFLP